MSALSFVTVTLVAAELTSIEVWRAREARTACVPSHGQWKRWFRMGIFAHSSSTPRQCFSGSVSFPPLLLLKRHVLPPPAPADGAPVALATGNATAAAAPASLGGALYRRTPLSRSSAGSTAPSATSAPRSGPCSGSPAQPPGSLGT